MKTVFVFFFVVEFLISWSEKINTNYGVWKFERTIIITRGNNVMDELIIPWQLNHKTNQIKLLIITEVIYEIEQLECLLVKNNLHFSGSRVVHSSLLLINYCFISVLIGCIWYCSHLLHNIHTSLARNATEILKMMSGVIVSSFSYFHFNEHCAKCLDIYSALFSLCTIIFFYAFFIYVFCLLFIFFFFRDSIFFFLELKFVTGIKGTHSVLTLIYGAHPWSKQENIFIFIKPTTKM